MIHTWDNITTWNLVLPPSRPSFRQLSLLAQVIEQTPRVAPVAVLGSTPEYRDFVHEAGFRLVFVFDNEPRFYESMTAERIHTSAEHFIEGDWWTTLPQHSGAFALILSDLTSGNVPYDTRGRFYDAISDALAPGGIFFDKVLTHPGPLEPLDEILATYERTPLNLASANRFSCEALFCSCLLDEYEGVVDSSAFYERILGISTSARIHAFVEAAKFVTPEGCHWYYGRRWSELRGSYCARLQPLVEEPDEPSSPYYGRLRYFAFRRSL